MVAMAASTGTIVRTFIVLFSVMLAAFAHLFLFGDFVSCFDVHSRWWVLAAADFAAYAAVTGGWVAYKESSWIKAAIVVVAIYIFGSLISIGYILMQFYKLSHEEYSNDPLYFVLAKRQKREVSKGTSVLVARITFSVLGCLGLGVLIYTIIIDLSPPYKLYFTSCLPAIVIDTYIFVVTLSVWVAYKESNWASAFFWIALLICFRGVTVCAYIVRELFYLSPQLPASLIIVKSGKRDLHSS